VWGNLNKLSFPEPEPHSGFWRRLLFLCVLDDNTNFEVCENPEWIEHFKYFSNVKTGGLQENQSHLGFLIENVNVLPDIISIRSTHSTRHHQQRLQLEK
jgi:hypothetical protein